MISIVVCTYNRCESLRETLQALLRQEVRNGLKVEIIVVDNHSSDRTPDVVLDVARRARLPIRYVFESQQGLSYARNHGVRAAAGEFIAFTDDDVMPEPGWVQAVVDGFERHRADFVGGRIVPRWLDAPPGWWSADERTKEKLWGILALVDYGHEPIVFGPDSHPQLLGANFAVRASCFEELGVFRVDLGHRGNVPAGGEETELEARWLRAGKRVVYLPDAVVHHKIPDDRTRMPFIRRCHFHAARSRVRVAAPAAGTPRWLMRECVQHGAQALWAYARGRRHEAMYREIDFWIQLGQIAGGLDARRRPSTTARDGVLSEVEGRRATLADTTGGNGHG